MRLLRPPARAAPSLNSILKPRFGGSRDFFTRN